MIPGAAAKYVDVMNTKPAPSANVPQSLFNVMPSSHSSPAIFSPGKLSVGHLHIVAYRDHFAWCLCDTHFAADNGLQ